MNNFSNRILLNDAWVRLCSMVNLEREKQFEVTRNLFSPDPNKYQEALDYIKASGITLAWIGDKRISMMGHMLTEIVNQVEEIDELIYQKKAISQ